MRPCREKAVKFKYDRADFAAFFCWFVRVGPAGAVVVLAVAGTGDASGDEAIVVPAVRDVDGDFVFSEPSALIQVPNTTRAPNPITRLRTK
jgi:hypothetical protein